MFIGLVLFVTLKIIYFKLLSKITFLVSTIDGGPVNLPATFAPLTSALVVMVIQTFKGALLARARQIHRGDPGGKQPPPPRVSPVCHAGTIEGPK